MYVSTSKRHKDFAFAYNTAVHETTKYSPYYLVYGQEPNHLLEIALLPPEDVDRMESIKKLHIAREVALAKTQQAKVHMKRRYDASHRDTSYNVEDLVRVFIPRREKGLLPVPCPDFRKLNLTLRKIRLTLEIFKDELTGDLRCDIRADPSIIVNLIDFRTQQPFHSYTSKLPQLSTHYTQTQVEDTELSSILDQITDLLPADLLAFSEPTNVEIVPETTAIIDAATTQPTVPKTNFPTLAPGLVPPISMSEIKDKINKEQTEERLVEISCTRRKRNKYRKDKRRKKRKHHDKATNNRQTKREKYLCKVHKNLPKSLSSKQKLVQFECPRHGTIQLQMKKGRTIRIKNDDLYELAKKILKLRIPRCD
jgi:hypothetical protein